MSINCTWVHCLENATQPQRSSDGSIWANLCSRHEHELVQAVRSGEAPSLCRAWVLAQGGSEKAAERMAPTREVLARVLSKVLRND